jgi:hypothetical protein
MYWSLIKVIVTALHYNNGRNTVLEHIEVAAALN